MLRTIASSLLTSRLCRRIAACVFLSIVAIETAILAPSYHQVERKPIFELTDPGGAITVSAACERGGIAIAVADTGIGMAAESIATALAPFGQVDSSLARRHERTGLGLPLAASFMQLHDGTLEMESMPGKGTVARLRFPAGRTLTPGTGKRRIPAA